MVTPGSATGLQAVERQAVSRTLSPLHPSARGKPVRPYNMAYAPPMSVETIETFDRISLEIFTDMANAGRAFQECLTAIYLSGLAHACSVLTKDDEAP